MFWHIYKYKLLSTFRDFAGLVWTLIFPLVLSTLFFFAFSSIDEANQFKLIPICVVNDSEFEADVVFKSTIETLSKESDEQMFITTYTDVDTADKMLKNSEIEGYIQIIDGSPSLKVKANGLNQTILKSFLDQYIQTRSSMETILKEHPEKAESLAEMFSRENITKEVSLTKNPQTDTVNYYYALLAMVSLYGGFQGLQIITHLQANLSALGARRTSSAAKRYQLVIFDLLGGVTAHFICLMVVVAYMQFILGINFGNKLGLVILTCLVGSLTGVSFGALVSVNNKLKFAAKTAVIIAITMIASFLSGLMVTGINYTVMQKAPIVAWLNPAARITDAFYCLYYYDSYDRYFLNIGILLVMSVVMFGLTTIFVRRQKYASI